jgi:hypothetical protein
MGSFVAAAEILDPGDRGVDDWPRSRCAIGRLTGADGHAPAARDGKGRGAVKRERIARVALRAFPESVRTARGEEMLGTLLDVSATSRTRFLRELTGLVRSGLEARAARTAQNGAMRVVADGVCLSGVWLLTLFLASELGNRLRELDPGGPWHPLSACFSPPPRSFSRSSSHAPGSCSGTEPGSESNPGSIGDQPDSSSRFSVPRSASTAAASRSKSASDIPGCLRNVNTTSHPSPSAMTRMGL